MPWPFLTIVRHEWRTWRRDGRLLAIVVGLSVVSWHGVHTGASTWRVHDERVHRLEARTAERLRAWPAEMDAYAASAERWDVALPMPPAMTLSIGEAEVLAGTADVYTWSTPDQLLGASDLQNPSRLRTGRLDPAFVVVYLVPLLVILLAYDLLASEREDGTLALLLSQPVSEGTVVAAKVAARWGLVVGILVASMAAALAAERVPIWSADTAFRLVVMTGVAAVYVIVWLLLAAAIDAGGRPAVTNAVLLTAVWVTLLVVVPSILTSVIAAAYPVPAREALIAVDRAADVDIGRDGPPALERYRAVHAVDTAGLTARQTNRVQLLLAFLENEGNVERMATEIRDAVRRRDRALARWAWLSPALVAQHALSVLAGTDTDRHRVFEDRVIRLVGQHRAFFTPRVVRWTPFRRDDAMRVPTLQSAEPSLDALLRSVIADLGRLLVLPCGALCVVWWRRRRGGA